MSHVIADHAWPASWRMKMLTKHVLRWPGLLALLALLLSACGGTGPAAPAAGATSAPAAAPTTAPAAAPTAAPAAGGGTTESNFQIPAIEDGKFNVGMVLIGPHDDGGWSQAHYEGLQYLEK